MAILLAEIQPDDVVRAFKHDVPYLFAGAAFITVGIIALAFTAFRKKYDQLLIYFAFFASLYGVRLWLQSDLGTFSLRSSFLFMRLRTAIDYLMPVPAFLFLNAAGLLGRFTRIVLSAFALVGLSCAIAACLWGPSNRLSQINQLVAIIALIVLTASMLRKNSSAGPDLAAVRRGLLVFVALALINNLREALNFPVPGIEPLGFAIFLGSLGYVAARRTLQRDRELREIQSELEIANVFRTPSFPRSFPPPIISSSLRVICR